MAIEGTRSNGCSPPNSLEVEAEKPVVVAGAACTPPSPPTVLLTAERVDDLFGAVGAAMDVMATAAVESSVNASFCFGEEEDFLREPPKVRRHEHRTKAMLELEAEGRTMHRRKGPLAEEEEWVLPSTGISATSLFSGASQALASLHTGVAAGGYGEAFVFEASASGAAGEAEEAQNYTPVTTPKRQSSVAAAGAGLTPARVRELEAAVREGRFRETDLSLTPERRQLVRDAMRALRNQKLLHSPKRQEVGRRVAELVVTELIARQVEEESGSPAFEREVVRIVRESGFLTSVLGPAAQAGTPRGVSSFSLPCLLSGKERSPHDALPLLDIDHICTPEGFHLLTPEAEERFAVRFVRGPIVHPQTGVLVGHFETNVDERVKFSSFFPRDLFPSVIELKDFLLKGRRIASFQNRHLMKNQALVYELYLQERSTVVRSAFPIFHFIELDRSPATRVLADLFDLPEPMAGAGGEDIPGAAAAGEKRYSLIPGLKTETTIEGLGVPIDSMNRDDLHTMIRAMVLTFMGTYGDVQSPLRFVTNDEQYIFDLGPTYGEKFGVRSGLYVAISGDTLERIFGDVRDHELEDVIASLRES